jgi:hypothetical protein
VFSDKLSSKVGKTKTVEYDKTYLYRLADEKEIWLSERGNILGEIYKETDEWGDYVESYWINTEEVKMENGGVVENINEEEVTAKIKEHFAKVEISDYLTDMPASVKKLWSYVRKKTDSSSASMIVKFDNADVRDFFHYAYRALYGQQYGDNNIDFKAVFIKKWGQQALGAIEMMHDQKRMVLKNGAMIAISTNKYGKGVLQNIYFFFPHIFSGIESNVKFYAEAKKKPVSERNSGEALVIEWVEEILNNPKMEQGGNLNIYEVPDSVFEQTLFHDDWMMKAEHGANVGDTDKGTLFS